MKSDIRATTRHASSALILDEENWHDIEICVTRAAEAGNQVRVRVADDAGDAPLARLPISDIELVKNILQSTWPRLGRSNHPTSLEDDSLEQLIDQLRALLERTARSDVRSPPSARLRFPPLNHPWCSDEAFGPWWYPHLFWNTHRVALRAWIDEVTDGEHGRKEVANKAWLRALLHRIASEDPTQQRLELLRHLYADDRQRTSLVADDEQFAAEFDLTRFGGPWTTRLGIERRPRRRKPFAIPKPRLPKTDTPDITVLIPSYRHGKFIGKTIRSVLGQSYAEHRVLVADDRSPDGTVAAARRVKDDRVAVRVNDENVGLGNSVLRALETIDTPFVALLNSDDLLHPEHLSSCRKALLAEPEKALVATDLTLIDDKDGHLDQDNASLIRDGKKVLDWTRWFASSQPDDDLDPDRQFEELLKRNYLITSSNIFARTEWLLEQADALRSLKYCLDWRLFLEAARTDRLVHLRRPLVAYRLHPSNTVWFEEGRRHTYYLEVNRVAAEALRDFVADRPDAPDVLSRVVTAVANYVRPNSETDGYALFLNTLLDSLALDSATATDEHIAGAISALSRGDISPDDEASQTTERAAQEEREQILARLAREQLELEQRRRETAERRADTLQSRTVEIEAALNAAHEKLDLANENSASLQRDLAEARATATTIGQLRVLVDQELKATRAELSVARSENTELQTDRKSLRADLSSLRSDLAPLRAERDRAHARAASLERQLEKVRQRAADLQSRLEQRLAEQTRERSNTQKRIEDLRQNHQQQREMTRQAHEERTEKLRSRAERAEADKARLRAEKEQLVRSRNELAAEVQRLHQEADSLRRTREFRTGNFFWNKMPLAYMSRRGKKWYRRLVDAKNRARMVGSRLLGRSKKPQGTAVVAACWQWPIYSHTFVYQEMVSLTHMGLDVQLFHWELGDTDQLHDAFRYLYENRTELQPVWEQHERDRQHFEKLYPGRLRALLERIAPLCGKSVDELENDPLVMQACTFARMAELADAKYIHSYFFYDQSFMAMVAAWLLELPRGVSCYADHMMNDYAFKLVPLHVELCDVIVATSARIKRELSELSGGGFDDKIIVKPNGVDGERFPARQRPARNPDEPFEVISVSRIEPKKGLTYLVEAIAMLRDRGHKVIAHVIGSKDEHSKGSLEYAEEFERCIEKHGLQEQIVLHGMMKQEQMPPLIERSRAFVAPYIETDSGDKDGIPTAMLEALASSLPVVTTNSGSITEVVQDGVEGLIVPQRDSKAYADALEKVITDADLEQRLATAARARFDREFDTKVTETRLHERITGFLERRSKAGA